MIYVNGQQLTAVRDISSKAQLVLSMIDGGLKWLTWSIADTTQANMNVANENALLLMIQEGLCGDEYIRFNTFRANINKILSMSDDDIMHLAAVRRTDNDNETGLASLLQSNNLVSYAEIATADDVAKALVAGRPDLFQAMGFDEMLMFATFIKDQQGTDADLQSASHSFAMQKAINVSDFINLCLFYQYSKQNIISGSLIPQIQSAEMELMLTQIEEVVKPYLFTPKLDFAANDGTLQQAIANLANNTGYIGYLTASSAALNLIRNIAVNGLSPAQLVESINNYLIAVKNQIRSAQSSTSVASQTENASVITFYSGQSEVIIGTDKNSVVYLLPETKIYSN